MGDQKNRQRATAERVSEVLRVSVDPATITPLGHMLLLERLPEGTTEAGLVLPDSVKLRNRARVRRVGTGHLCEGTGTRVPLGVKEGDLVVLGPGTAGMPIGSLPNGNALMLVEEGHVLAIDTAGYEPTMRVPTLGSGEAGLLGSGETLQ